MVLLFGSLQLYSSSVIPRDRPGGRARSLNGGSRRLRVLYGGGRFDRAVNGTGRGILSICVRVRVRNERN